MALTIPAIPIPFPDVSSDTMLILEKKLAADHDYNDIISKSSKTLRSLQAAAILMYCQISTKHPQFHSYWRQLEFILKGKGKEVEMRFISFLKDKGQKFIRIEQLTPTIELSGRTTEPKTKASASAASLSPVTSYISGTPPESRTQGEIAELDHEPASQRIQNTSERPETDATAAKASQASPPIEPPKFLHEFPECEKSVSGKAIQDTQNNITAMEISEMEASPISSKSSEMPSFNNKITVREAASVKNNPATQGKETRCSDNTAHGSRIAIPAKDLITAKQKFWSEHAIISRSKEVEVETTIQRQFEAFTDVHAACMFKQMLDDDLLQILEDQRKLIMKEQETKEKDEWALALLENSCSFRQKVNEIQKAVDHITEAQNLARDWAHQRQIQVGSMMELMQKEREKATALEE